MSELEIVLSDSQTTDHLEISFSESSHVYEPPTSIESENLYKCTVCLRSYSDLIELQRHYATHIVSASFKCVTCGATFETDEELESHEINHDNIFSCEKCNLTYNSKSALTAHRNKSKGCKESFQYVCKECDAIFSRKKDLVKHEITHSMPFMCDVCGLSLFSKIALTIHQRDHTYENYPSSQEIIYPSARGEKRIKNKAKYKLSYTCHICHLPCFSRESLNDHLSKHSSSSLTCNACFEIFTTLESLHEHEKTHTQAEETDLGTRFVCCVCKEEFEFRRDMLIHINVHDVAEPMKCPVCSETFFFSYVLHKHISMHSREGTCNICLKTFTSEMQLAVHEKTHLHKVESEDKLCYVCQLCDESFSTQPLLVDHYSVTHSSVVKKKFRCDICHESYFFCYQLLLHKPIHAPDYLYKCNLCPKRLPNEIKFSEHLKMHSKLTFKCDICKKTFHSKERLRSHASEHVKKIFTCDVCGQKFARPICFKKHTERHLNEPFKCHFCGKVFHRQFHLENHLKTHTTRKHRCYVCNIGFKTIGAMKKHFVEEHPDMTDTYACDVCGLKTKHQSSFIRHYKLHTGVRNHKCQYCQKGFIDKVSLFKHHKHNHEGLELHFPFNCDYCQKGFLTKWGIRLHYHKYHNVRMEVAAESLDD